jgi:hydrogenase maturation protease
MTAAHGNRGRDLIIGVGNRDRGDDAVGPIVCDLVRDLRRADDLSDNLSDVATAVFEGSVVDLPTRWGSDDRVTIVDAAAPAGSPGRVTTVDVLRERLTTPGTISTHSIDVGAAIELARALDRLPAELTVIGVEAASCDFGAPLTPDVQRAAGRVATELSRRARLPAADS